MDIARLDNDKLLHVGMNAVLHGDLAKANDVLRHFGPRRTRLAAENERQLRAAVECARQRGYLSQHDQVVVHTGGSGRAHEVVTDQAIHPQIMRMIDAARHSVWLASLTPPSAEIAALLERVARRVRVVLIVAERYVKSWTQRERMARLEAAGVECRLLKSTHAKVGVIDEMVYMIGSANLHGVHRDLCVVGDDTVTAQFVIDYLERLR